jgi:ATP-dependent Lon protease
MPGKIIQALKKAGTNNPLILLDEVDKLGADWRGDPSSALLEVLDPEQNNSFQDHYLEVDCDLSNIMFITTANTLNMPKPLMDRMEIIRLSGYTELEKLEIAKSHLLPKVIKEHGLDTEEFSISDNEIKEIIQSYTREAGVRGLEREISKLSRKLITEILVKNKKKVKINQKVLSKFLGVPKFKHSEIENKDMVGLTTGLAWTEVGGELLSIESALSPGKGKISSTGKLGDVMKESIQAAEAFVKSRANLFGISLTDIEKSDIHVHVPEGATPKDGPSAGVAMITSIISCLTGNPVKHLVAMTGEMTLRGRVLPIGGLKEKLLAASRGGIKTVIIPKDNEKDLSEIPDNIKDGLDIKPISFVDQALEIALVNPLIPIKEDIKVGEKDGEKSINIQSSVSKTEITAH